MYLLIFEDGSLRVTGEVLSDDLLRSADDGILDIVNMDEILQYHNGEWIEIQMV